MYLHKELSWKIIGFCFKIHNEYGNGHNERIYHKALEEEFKEDGINYISKPRLSVYSKKTGKQIGFYEPDYLIENLIVLEIKARPMNKREDEIQLLEYIKTTPYEVGYLVNFGCPSLYQKRIIFTNDRKIF